MVRLMNFLLMLFIGVIGILVLSIHFPSLLWSCPVCYGNVETPVTRGMNMAIFTMMGITGIVLGSFVSFFVYMRKRGIK